jgi:dCTP deaminase
MILSGLEIDSEVQKSRIIITPFYTKFIEPNSYGFHLASKLIVYDDALLDPGVKMQERHIIIPESGYCLQPGTFYLGSTLEKMGSDHYAATLYANRSVSTMGMWIQFSAPLGHTGAIIPWTLEMRVSHPTIVYPGMLIGKIAFWQPYGDKERYDGKYIHSTEVVASRIVSEIKK